MPKFTDAEQTRLMSEHMTMPLDARSREIVANAEYSLRMMHHGAMLRRCDWGIDWEADGIEVLLPQMGAARVLLLPTMHPLIVQWTCALRQGYKGCPAGV
jgi:hypothetical protein